MIDEPRTPHAPPAAPLVAALPLTTPFVAPEELARRTGRADLLRLGANESAYGPPPRALEAMRDELARAAYYGDPEAVDLRAALAAKHGCAIENISVGAGIDELLGLAARAYLAPGDAAVGALGTYPTFVYHVVGFGARFETIPYDEDGSIDLAALAAKARATPSARIVYLANPDNPSGSFASRERVARLVEELPERSLFVLDEAYADFVARDELPEDAIDPRVLRLRTFSKAFGMAGTRIAYALGSREAIETFQKIRHHFGVNRIAQAGALAALAETRFVDEVVADVARGRAEYAETARELGLATLPSRTNFVLFDLGSRGRAEAMVAELLRAGVFVRKPGQPPLDRCIRVTVGTSDDRARFHRAFGDALRALDANLGRA